LGLKGFVVVVVVVESFTNLDIMLYG